MCRQRLFIRKFSDGFSRYFYGPIVFWQEHESASVAMRTLLTGQQGWSLHNTNLPVLYSVQHGNEK
jgi:hypothetical protein